MVECKKCEEFHSQARELSGEVHRLRAWIYSHEPEAAKLVLLIQNASAEMIHKLVDKMLDGYTGWDQSACFPGMVESLKEHVERIEGGELGQWLDVANLAIMLDAIEARNCPEHR